MTGATPHWVLTAAASAGSPASSTLPTIIHPDQTQ
jgi:hypothetical protein